MKWNAKKSLKMGKWYIVKKQKINVSVLHICLSNPSGHDFSRRISVRFSLDTGMDKQFWRTKYFCFSQLFFSIAVTHVVLFWVKSNLRLLRVCDISGHQLFYFSYVFQSRSIWLGIAVTATVGQNARVFVFGHWSDVKLISRTPSRFHINCKTRIKHKHYVKVNLTEKDIYSLFVLFNSVDILRLFFKLLI